MVEYLLTQNYHERPSIVEILERDIMKEKMKVYGY